VPPIELLEDRAHHPSPLNLWAWSPLAHMLAYLWSACEGWYVLRLRTSSVGDQTAQHISHGWSSHSAMGSRVPERAR
jgi:hypothetical protein